MVGYRQLQSPKLASQWFWLTHYWWFKSMLLVSPLLFFLLRFLHLSYLFYLSIYTTTLFLYFHTQACFVFRAQDSRSIDVSCFANSLGICVLLGCIVFNRYVCKRSCIDRPWSSQRVGWYHGWSVGQSRVALLWALRVGVALPRSGSSLPRCSLLERSRIWEWSVYMRAGFDGQPLP